MSQYLPTTPVQSPPPQAFEPISVGISEDSKQALLEQWRAITRHKLPILALTAMVMIVATVIAFALTPIYKATATLMIEPGKGKVVSIDDVYSSGVQAKEFYQSQVEILKSREVAVRTAASLKLWELKDYDPRIEGSGLGAMLKRAIGLRAEPVVWTPETLAEAAGLKLMEDISVEPVRLSQLVKVSVETPNKVLSMKLANAVAQNYIEADRDARYKVTQQANVWLTSRMSELLQKLTDSETALQTYREQQGLVALGGSTQTLVSQQATDLNARLTEARTKRVQLESAYQQVARITNGDYSKVPVVVANYSVSYAMQKEVEAEQRVATLASNLGTEHSTYKEALANLKSVRESTRQQRESIAKSVLADYEAARSTERQLEGALSSLRGAVQANNRQEFQLSVLEREVASNRQLYDMFMSRAKETDLTADLQSAVARVVDSASPPETPVRPKKVQLVAIAGMLSLILGSLVAMLMAKLDNTVKTGEELEDRLQLPVLTTLPLLVKQAATNASRMFLEQPQSQHAEAIRTARTGVLLSSIDRNSKVILVTSSLPGEGKTTLATNLALAHAQTRRTILVDADMRKPQVGARLGLPPNAKGLSNLIAGTATLAECLHAVEGSPLMVIPSGDIPPNTLELLHSKRFEETVALLREAAEIVMIDSPPVEVVSDSLVIAPHAEGTIYVVKAMETAYPMARKGIGHLQRVGAKILGVVVNSLDFQQATRYYGLAKGYDNDSYYGVPQQPVKQISTQRKQA
jgi:succinoglycan biosynthesis transport protein ExoP